MVSSKRFLLVALLFAALTPTAFAQPVGEYYGGGYRSPYSGGRMQFGMVGGAYYGPNAPYQPNPFNGANPFLNPQFGPPGLVRPRGQEGPGGLMLPPPGNARFAPAATAVRSTNPTRSEELVELGDRAFRGGNYKRAEERYKLAAKANPETPTPHIHLAQIAIFRGEYPTAAGYFRDAIATTRSSAWLVNAPDIQSLYGEPGDFARQLARLESYLQTHPDDRNAWFVLGVENYFSGHFQQAADAFIRLSDRRSDEALTAFIAAATINAHRASQVEADETH